MNPPAMGVYFGQRRDGEIEDYGKGPRWQARPARHLRRSAIGYQSRR